MLKKLFLLFLLPALNIYSTMGADISSPNGNVSVDFVIDEVGAPHYSVQYAGKSAIESSQLGFILDGGIDLYSDFELLEIQNDSVVDLWSPVWGEESQITNKYHEALFKLHQKSTDRSVNVRFRVFDDGIGFRYEFPKQSKLGNFIISDELTEFAVPGDQTAYWIPDDGDSQEFHYTKCRLSEIKDNLKEAHVGGSIYPTPVAEIGVQTALMLKYDNGLYVNLHEAALCDYPAMCLSVDPQTFKLKAALTPYANGDKAMMHAPDKTPWRTIIVSNDARDILASRITLNLNEPCKIDDLSWIKPIKYMGVWWEMITGKTSWHYTDEATSIKIGETDYSQLKPNGRHAANTANVKRYIDFASAHGFDALLVEGWNEGWEDAENCRKTKIYSFTKPYPDFDLPGLRDYAKSKGVTLVMHHETASAVLDYERQLEAAFTFMNDNNYEFLKGGYIHELLPRGEHHYGQIMVNHYQYVLEKAAEHKLKIVLHEAVRPTGVCRTWPNLFGNESARGSEYHAFSGIKPDHTSILPFTRLIGGPMDYTPGLFEADLSKYNPYRNAHVNATIANQLALYVTMASPMQMAADLPETYEKYMDAFQFIKDVALDWDKSVYLEAEPMEYVTVARKAKNSADWFVGSTGGAQPRESQINFSFLPKGQEYQATIYRDGKTADYRSAPQDYVIETKKITSKSKIKIPVAAGGGYAIKLENIVTK